MPQLENKVSYEVRKPLTRTTLAEVVDTLDDAMVPVHANVQIINFNNGEGFTVKASWTKNVA